MILVILFANSSVASSKLMQRITDLGWLSFEFSEVGDVIRLLFPKQSHVFLQGFVKPLHTLILKECQSCHVLPFFFRYLGLSLELSLSSLAQ